MSAEIHQALGQHGAEIEALQRDMADLKNDVKFIRETLAQAKGGWRTLMLVAGVAGSVGALIGKLLPFLR